MSVDRDLSRRLELPLLGLADETSELWALALALIVVHGRLGSTWSTRLYAADGGVIALPDEQRIEDSAARSLRRPDPGVLKARPTVLVTGPAGPSPTGDLRVELSGAAGAQRAVLLATGRAETVAAFEAVLPRVDILVRAGAEAPDRRLAEVDVLTAAEHETLQAWNGPVVDYPATTLHQMFAAQAARTPNAAAIIDGARTLTYAELDQSSNRVARQLRAHVRAAGQVVAAGGPRCADTLVVQIGIMKAGAAYLYIDPATPVARVRQMYDIAQPVAVVAPGASQPPVAEGIPLLVLEDLVGALAVSAAPVHEIADESTAAYVLFTSGSTGEPKGVVRPHRMHTTRVVLEQRLYGLGPTDRHLMKSVPFFREFFWALATGGSVVVAQPGGEQDDTYLVDLIRESDITVCSFVPSMLRVLLANSRFTESRLPIRHLFTAGEVVDADLERQLRDLGIPVHVTYTLAEADYVCHRGVAENAPGVPNPVGRPLDMQVYICDAAGRRCPPGVVGEIYTGGPGLADGYLNRPLLTAERFVDNPFDPDIAPRLFRTGDLGRFRADGQLEFVGRADAQVKIRGQRVEPTEVEQALRLSTVVENALVTSLSDPQQGAVLVAYVVLHPGHDLDARELRAAVGAVLPAYMVPTLMIDVPELPRLESGKVDRAALQTPVATRPPGLPRPVEAATDIERKVAAAWAMVLGFDEVGVEDTFVDLGGDSLRLMLLRHALEKRLGRSVGLAELLSAPTVRDFADALQEGR